MLPLMAAVAARLCRAVFRFDAVLAEQGPQPLDLAAELLA